MKNINLNRTGKLGLGIFLGVILSTAVRADTFSSGSFTTDSVLTDAGNEVYGVDLNGTGGTTANGFTFSSTNSNFSDVNNAGFGQFLQNYEVNPTVNVSTGDAAFDEVLTTGYYGNQLVDNTSSNGPNRSIMLTGLTPNTKYSALFLDADVRSEANGVTFTVSDNGSSTTGVTQTYGFKSGMNSSGDPAVASYILDQFITGAGQTTESFSLSVSGTSRGQLDGFVLGKTLPEPATYAYLGLGVLALFWLARRTAQKF